MSREGREQAMLFLHAPEVFGDVSVFTGAPYPGTVIALEPTVVWRLPAAAVLDLTARHPELALAVIRRLGERILHYVQLVEDLSLRSVEARLAGTLLSHAERQPDGQLVVPRRAWTTFDEMATRLGTVRDVLSRTLHNLEAAGLLEVRRHEIVLRDLPGLEARARQ
jgi:CRP-like cAMP-binding protein